MIRWVRTAIPSDNKAIHWAKEVTEYINKIYPDVHLKVFQPRFGKLNLICWTADVDDLAALEVFQNKVSADEEYQKIRAEGGEYFVFGSMFDKVMETL